MISTFDGFEGPIPYECFRLISLMASLLLQDASGHPANAIPVEPAPINLTPRFVPC